MEECILNNSLKNKEIFTKEEIDYIYENIELISLIYIISAMETIKFIKRQS